MHHRFAAGLLSLLVLALLLSGCSSGAPTEPAGAPTSSAEPAVSGPSAVAEVSGVTITEEALQARLDMVTSDSDVARAIDTTPETGDRLRAVVLAGMVDAVLAAQAAPDLGVRVSDADLAAYLDEIATRYLEGGPDAWARYLEQTGYPEDQVRDQLREDLVRERVEDALDPEARAADAAVRAAYADGYAGRLQVAHVLVATQQEADRLHSRLTGGAEMADLARDHSLDTATAQGGGELGPWTKGTYTASFDEAIEDATGPGVLPVVSSPFGWHVIEVRAPATFDDVADEIAEGLVEKQQDAAFVAWLAELRADVPVWIRDDEGRWDAATGSVVAP